MRCLYNLSSVDLSLSVEVFPPKGKRDFVSVIGDYLIACGNVLPGFVSLSCGAGSRSSYKLLLALSSFVAAPSLLVRLVRVDKSFETLQATVQSIARLGISKLLFLRGDYCVSSQLRLDLISSFRILREARCLSLFCGTADYSGAHNLGANTRLG